MHPAPPNLLGYPAQAVPQRAFVLKHAKGGNFEKCYVPAGQCDGRASLSDGLPHRLLVISAVYYYRRRGDVAIRRGGIDAIVRHDCGSCRPGGLTTPAERGESADQAAEDDRAVAKRVAETP